MYKNEMIARGKHAIAAQQKRGARRVTSNGGLMLFRELDERLGLGELIEKYLTDSRAERNSMVPIKSLKIEGASSIFPASEIPK
jgi:hypothetical protein